MTAVDTNVLVYARDPRDPVKQATAASLIATAEDGVLLWQVACEYLAAYRKLAPHGFGYEQAVEDVQALRKLWTTVLPDWPTMDRAAALQGRFSLSFWDALLIANCLEAGVDRLYSEDFSAYAPIDSLEIVNPFR